MQVGELAKATGKESQQVATDLGLDTGRGVALRRVDDVIARAYLEAAGKGEAFTPEHVEQQQAAEVVRFWSRSRDYMIPADGTRGDIRFRKWSYEGAAGSEEVAYLRGKRDYFIAQGTYEVVMAPHEDPMKVADFAQALLTVIMTGPRGDPTPSREGRDAVVAILPVSKAAELTSVQKSSPRQLVREVARRVSLVVEAYQETL